MANYYRKFIEGFSKIAAPLNALFASCDASDTAVGYTLGQKTKDNKEVVIAYGGKSLTKEEKKYTTTEKELLAVVRGSQAYRQYLACNKFTIYTDYLQSSNLAENSKTYWQTWSWALKLQEYNFDIIHKLGKKNCVADALSRIPSSSAATGPTVSIQNPSVPLPLEPIPILQKNDVQEGVQVMFSYDEPEGYFIPLYQHR